MKSSIHSEDIEIVKKWIPEDCKDEPITSQLMHAILQANACIQDLQRTIAGKEPIRSLDSYPLN